MINEYSLTQILERAHSLVSLNLSNIEVFLDPLICNKILASIFKNPTVQNNLKKLILLKNPMIDSTIFSENFIQ
jgi:hypothetical protein